LDFSLVSAQSEAAMASIFLRKTGAGSVVEVSKLVESNQKLRRNTAEETSFFLVNAWLLSQEIPNA
jgi:hypothetical protein